jgi:chemotaxis methyl-accepting protein methylase
MAITLIEALEQTGDNVPIVVFGTDLSQRMVEHARAGLYPESIESDVTREQLRRFFVKVDELPMLVVSMVFQVSGDVAIHFTDTKSPMKMR